MVGPQSLAGCGIVGLGRARLLEELIHALWVIPAKAGIVRLKAHLVREVEVLFRYALSGL